MAPTGSPRFFVDLTIADAMTLAGHGLVWAAIWWILSGRIEWAISALVLAMLLDALDGMVARRLGVARPFGRYLGSFVDLINYTVAPPLLLHSMGYREPWQVLVLFGYSTCGLLRLSKFNEVGNITEEGSLAYLGLPVFWVHFLIMILYGVRALDPARFSLATTIGLLVLSPCFLLDRPFYKPQRYGVIATITLVAAGFFAYRGFAP